MCGFTDTLKEVAIILWLDGWILCPSSVLIDSGDALK